MDLKTARDLLLERRDDYEGARAAFAWPAPEEFNWALEWFDPFAQGNDDPGLWIVGADGSVDQRSFDDLYRRSKQVANRLR
jgi:acetyl-CoA synthetase